MKSARSFAQFFRVIPALGGVVLGAVVLLPLLYAVYLTVSLLMALRIAQIEAAISGAVRPRTDEDDCEEEESRCIKDRPRVPQCEIEFPDCQCKSRQEAIQALKTWDRVTLSAEANCPVVPNIGSDGNGRCPIEGFSKSIHKYFIIIVTKYVIGSILGCECCLDTKSGPLVSTWWGLPIRIKTIYLG